MNARQLLIGAGPGGPASERVTLDADAFTTHGVILGMTGSGKTGLAIVLLEEMARRRVPLVVCDLKGDLTNLVLTFPGLAAADFAPFVPADTVDRGPAAQEASERWRQGLAPWGLGEAEIRQVRDGLAWQILTPGSGLAPVDLLPALDAPAGYDPDVDPDGARARLDGTAAAILALVERGGDPLSDRDHVLVATLLDASWRQSRGMTLPELIRQIAEPPVSQFGVLDAETFYPARERQDLVRALNTVLASPAFGAWTRGVPLRAESFVGTSDAPRGSILYLAHLGDREKRSFLTLLFSSLLAWARSQPGTEHLRALLYLDEVQGIIPPSAVPPTKPPLLTLLKQGRAFGMGVVLATQNPVDLDYKALGNMGVKLVGRLDTEQDRERALAGLDLQASDATATVAALKPRQFLLAGAKAGPPRVLASRWAMSYLRGPLTLAEVKPLLASLGGGTTSPPQPESAAATSTCAPLLTGVEQLFADGAELLPAVLVEARVSYRKTSPAVQRERTGAFVAPFGDGRVLWEKLRFADLPGLNDAPGAGSRLAPLPGSASALLKSARKDFGREIDSQPLALLWHRQLKLVQEDGETDDAFRARCADAARETRSTDAAEAVRRRYEAKLRTADERIAREQLALQQDEQELAAREQQKNVTLAAGVGDALISGLGMLLGGRKSIGGLARRGVSTAKQVTNVQRMAARAQAEVDESLQTIQALEAEKVRLAAELEAELARLDEQAGRAGDAVETLRLQPASRDIDVRRVALAWLPTSELP